MKKTSLTRALVVAGVMAAAGAMAHADAIFYPDGTHVNLGENAVENGVAAQVLAQSPSTAPNSSMLASLGVSADQGQIFASNPMMDDTVAYDSSIDTTTLGAGPAMTTTTVTTSPVYVFPNINFDRNTVMSQPHPMMSRTYGYNYTPDSVALVPSTTIVDTTALGAGPADMTMLPPPVVVPDNSYNWWSDAQAPVGGPMQPDSASE